jgi:hypothetical protein
MFRAGLIVSNQGRSKMRLSKFLAVGTAAASLILIVAAPSHAQKSKTIQNQRQQTTVKPVAVKTAIQQGGPSARDHRTNSRDHRKANTPAPQGGVTVTSTGRKRGSTPCIKSVLGGPCIGGAVGKAAKTATEAANKWTPNSGVQGVYDAAKAFKGKPKPNRDHRKK